MKTQVTKSQFKAKVLELLRKIERTGEPVVVTDHGKPVVEVRPYQARGRDPLTRLKGSVLSYRAPTRSVAEKDWEAV
jgi:prevent-host-death family protein